MLGVVRGRTTHFTKLCTGPPYLMCGLLVLQNSAVFPCGCHGEHSRIRVVRACPVICRGRDNAHVTGHVNEQRAFVRRVSDKPG